MYSGINIKAAAKYITNIDGIEVHSKILLEAVEITSTNITIGVGSSEDCHLR